MIKGHLLALALIVAQPARADDAPAVDLTNLLQVVEMHYPSVIAAMRERDAAKANALSAAGAFDLKLKFNSRNDPLGFYENRVLEALVEQPLRVGGTTLFGGWRRGDGLFPFQEEKRETQSAGEILFGVSTPLLRDARIDEPRARLRQTALGIEFQQAAFDQLRLLVQQAATEQLLRWETAARRQAIYADLLRLAIDRNDGLREQIAIGEKAKIDATDNDRLIAARQESALAARQKLEAAAIKLSLYWRDTEGNPLIPPATPAGNFLDAALPAPEIQIPAAIESHPEMIARRRLLAAERVNQDLYQNQLLPQLDLSLSASQDLGIGSKTKEDFEFRIGAAFEFPFQNRKARGAADAAGAKIAALEQKLRLLADQLWIRVRTADANIARINERLARLEDRRRLTLQMREAEAERVELKLSDLLRLNLREQDVAAAEVDLVDTRLELRLAELERLSALAVDLLRPANR